MCLNTRAWIIPDEHLCLALSFWWEIPALLYRTILTGWLLLISNPIRIVRLLIALFLSVGYLVAILECQPFRRKSDGVLASWGQVLFICIFGNGILVRGRRNPKLDCPHLLS